MADAADHSRTGTVLSCDLAVVGAGIVGLWIARLAAKAGMDVVVCDSGAAGGGASGGFLGALMPHMPERWNEKKQFQFEALSSLPGYVAALETETGLSVGYRRVGRLLPLTAPHHRTLAEARKSDAGGRWIAPGGSFGWSVMERPTIARWPDARAAPQGVVFERLSARIDPRRLCAALTSAIRADRRVTLIENDGVADIAASTLRLASGRTVRFDALAISAGAASFAMLGRLLEMPARSLGIAVKGQAALLRVPEADTSYADRPLVFHDGIYVVPHDHGLVAVGSTSENDFEKPLSTDGRLDDVIAAAIRLCPELGRAEIVERWVGLRPKAIGRDPMLGPLPGAPRIIAATGGFKITLGIAHHMAEAVVASVSGARTAIPASFAVEAHLAKAEKSARRR